MAVSSRPPKNSFVAFVRKIYNPIGFAKGYNFVLWFILVGALLGFSLARFQYVDFYGRFCTPGGGGGAAPGECFDFLRIRRYTIGMIIHLVTILPGSLLACLQFVPVIRHKAVMFHCVNGYAVLLLSLVSMAGVYMVLPASFGGSIEIRTGGGALGIAFIVSLILAYINIKRMQIEQHRAWMLRAWVYAGCIITLRLIQYTMAIILPMTGDHYYSMSCAKVAYTIDDNNVMLSTYSACEEYLSGTNQNQYVAVRANLSDATNAAEAAAILEMTFGAAMWLAFIIHAFGVELYLHLTPAESERLRRISYERQLAAGMRHPGRAGLTVDRLGDSNKWMHPSEKMQSCDEAGLVQN